MINTEKPDSLPDNVGGYIVVDKEVWNLRHHPTDFSVIADAADVQKQLYDFRGAEGAEVRQLAAGMTRITVKDEQETDRVMNKVREQSVAHHIYRIDGIDEEVKITDRIILVLRDTNPDYLPSILREYKLALERRDDTICVLKVTDASTRNPLKIANEIARRDGVESCKPETLFPMQHHFAAAGISAFLSEIAGKTELFKRQWPFTTALQPRNRQLDPTASINLLEAWDILKRAGKLEMSEIVVAVIDDGFDLKGHEAFLETRIHPHPRNFVDPLLPPLPVALDGDQHGTPVASIVAAKGGKIRGVAPDCILLPIRIAFTSEVRPDDVLEALEAANQDADVVNCSFGSGTTQVKTVTGDSNFMSRVSAMIKNGGRRGRGLIIVFSAGNDNAPIAMLADENKNGIKVNGIELIKPGQPVHSGYTEIPGVLVVGAMSSLKRKASYSNWGTREEQITITAPSNDFRSNPAGLPVIAANNTPGVGDHYPRLTDAPGHTDYTDQFGGTSAAAPIVAGVIALMLSANRNLTAEEVVTILRDTADKELDWTVDAGQAPNLQGLELAFDVHGQSILFGAGKVNAARAVQAALDKVADVSQRPSPSGDRSGEARGTRKSSPRA